MFLQHIRMSAVGTIACLAFLPALVAGCAANIDPTKMIPGVKRGAAIPGSVSVRVVGGIENRTDASTLVSNNDVRSAVEKSLENASVFSAVRRDGPGDYLLDIQFDTDETRGGYEMLVQAHLVWKLTRRSSNAVVWQRTAHTKGQRTAFGLASPLSFLATAEEDATRENIKTAIEWMQKANISRGY